MRQNLEGNQAQASEIPHPMKSQRKHSIPLAMNCDDTWECCLPGNQRYSTQGFLLEAGHKTTCYFAYNKISESQRKTGLMQIPLLHTKTLLSFKERRDLFQSSSSQESTEGHLASRTFYVNSFLYNCLGTQGPQLHCICCYVPAPIFRIPLLYNQCNVVRLRIRFHYNSALIK